MTRNLHSSADHHAGLHSESGPNRGEHSGRAVNPIIKIADLAWLDFEKPNLAQAETFARDFGFEIVARDRAALTLRGSMPRFSMPDNPQRPAVALRGHDVSCGRSRRPAHPCAQD